MATNKKEELTNAAHVLNPIYNVNGFLTSSEQVLDEVIGKNQGAINQTINDGNISTIDNYFAIYKSNTYSGTDIFNDPEMNWVLIKDSKGKDIPEMTKDKPYLWNYKQINFIGGSKTGDEYIAPQIIPPSVVAVYSGIYKLEVFYQVTNDSINHPKETDENWKTDSPATTKEKPFLWQKRVTYFADKPNTPRTVEFNLVGTLGEPGIDGTDIEYIFKLTNTNKAPSNPTPENWNAPDTEATDDKEAFHNTYQDPDWKDETNGWYDDPQEPSFTMQFEWICERKRVFEKSGVDANGRTVGKYVWGQFTKPALWAKYSKEGLGIVEVKEAYLVSNVGINITEQTLKDKSNEDAPGETTSENYNTWYKNSPNVTVDYPFLWKRTTTKFKREDLPDTVIDESSERESVIYEMIGTLGEAGIDGTDIEYIFKLTNTNEAPSNPTPENWNAPDTEATDDKEAFHNTYQDPDWKDETNGWYDDPQEPSFTMQFEWICERKRVFEKSGVDANGRTIGKYVWGQFTSPALWAKYSKEGLGISEVKEAYLVSNVNKLTTDITGANSNNENTDAPSNASPNTWYKTSPNATVDYPFLWKRTKTRFKRDDDPSTMQDESFLKETTLYELIGTLGEPGIDGTDIEYIFKLTNTNKAPENPTPENIENEDYQKPDWKDEENGWYDDPQEPDFENPFEWICERKRTATKSIDTNGRAIVTYKWGAFTSPALWAKYSKEGLGIVEVKEAYLVSNVGINITEQTLKDKSNEDAPGETTSENYNTWYKNSPNVTVDYKYLWKRTTTKFKREDLPDTVKDESSERESVIYEMIGTLGEAGIDGTDIEYIFKLTNTNKAPSNPTPENWNAPDTEATDDKEAFHNTYQDPDWKDEENGWYDDPKSPTYTNPYEWICERKRKFIKTGVDVNGQTTGYYQWQQYSAPTLWAKYSKEGLGIVEVIVSYLKSNINKVSTTITNAKDSNEDAPTNAQPNVWYNTSPEVTNEHKYLWKRTKTKFNRGDASASEASWKTVYEVIGSMGDPGIDGAGIEWIHTSTLTLDTVPGFKDGYMNTTGTNGKKYSDSDYIPYSPDGANYIWSDDCPEPSPENYFIWRSQRRFNKATGLWGEFSTPITIYSYNTSSFKSTVFCRSEKVPETPTGGSSSSPWPEGDLWKDGIPEGTGENLWMSTRIFSSDSLGLQQAAWTEPTKLSDSVDMEIIYTANYDKKDIPADFKKESATSSNIDPTWAEDAAEAGWYDTPEQCGGDPWWMAVIYKVDGTWNDDWQISKIRGENGISPTTQFKSFVFCRSLSTPSKPEGGSYSNPLPEGTLWKDGIPTGNDPIWSSSRIFFSDNAASNWSSPVIMADTPDIEYIYSSFRNPQSPPEGFSKLGENDWDKEWKETANSLGWYDEPGNCKDDSGNADANPWWMAISRRINGTWSAWEKSKIRGEDGADGTSITVKGKFNSLAELKAAFPNGPADPSHTYIIGTHLYVWDGDSWEDMGEFKGEPGESAFLHIKYASSVIYDSNGNVSKVTLTGANGEEPGDYIGTFSDTNEDDPYDEESLKLKYKWKYWKGEDGFGYEYIYQLSNTYSAPDVPEYKYAEDGSEIAVNGKFSYNDDYVPEGWFDNPPSVSTTNKYAWVCYRKKISGAWTEYIGSTDKPGKASLWASMGEQGRGISENGVTECYALSKSSFGGYPDKSKEDPTGKTGWLRIKPSDTTTSLPTMDESYRYLWNYEIVTYTDNKSEETAPVLIGVFSLDGVGVKSIINYYRVCNSSTVVPDESNEDGMYLTTTTTTPLPGAFDPDVDYEDNVAFKYYPTDGWAENSPSVSSEYPFLWQKTVTQYTDGRADQIIYNCVGSADTAGVDSQTTEYIYYLASAGASKPSKPKYSSNQEEYWKQRYGNDYTPTGWYDDPPEMSIPGQKIYISSRIKSIPERYITTDGFKDINGNELKEVRNMVPIWGMFSEPELFATYSLDGRGIKSLEEFYKVSNSDTAPAIPTESNSLWNTWDGMSKTVGYNLGGINGAFSGWYYKKSQPADQNNPYLWNFERVLYSDGTSVVHPASNIGQYGREAVRLSFNTPFITYSTSPSNLISEDIVYSIKAKLYRGNIELDVKEYELYFDVNGDIPKGPETSDPTNSTASTGTADGTTTTPAPGSAEAIKQTLKGYITCKRDDDESNNQFIITVKQPSGLNKTNRIDTIIISVYGDSDLLVANGTIQALYTQRGEVGPSAAVGKTSYPAGTWDAGTNYKSTDTSTPYVWYDSTKKYYLLIADSAQGTSQNPENSSYWNPMDSFKAVYTEFLMADNANLGSANGSIIYSNLLYSQLGRDENGIDNRHYSVYLDKDGGMYSESEVTDVHSGTNIIHSFNGKFIPNTFIDFYRGSIACNKLSETYSYFNLYNSSGNINYIYEMDLNKSHNISINPRIDDYDSPYQVNWEHGTVFGYPGLIILPDYSTSSTWAEDGIHITITHQVDINWLKSQNSNFDHSNNSIVLVAADSRMFDSTKYNDSSITTDGKNLFLWRGVASKIIAIQPGATIKLRSSITFEETWINGELKKTAVGRNWIIENSEDFEPTKMYISVNNEKLYDLTVDPGAHNNPTPIVLGGNILSYPRSITDSGVTTSFNFSKSKFNSRGNVEDIITENNAYCFRVTTNPSNTESSNIELAWNKNDLGV